MRSARIGLALIAAFAVKAAAGEGGMGLRSAAPDAPVFSARLYGAPFAVIAIVPNPIVTACYKATPEYTYLYTPAGMVGAPPAMRLHTYGADTRYLLSPLSAHNTGASAYRWKGSPLYQHELGPNSGYALANRPAIVGPQHGMPGAPSHYIASAVQVRRNGVTTVPSRGLRTLRVLEHA